MTKKGTFCYFGERDDTLRTFQPKNQNVPFLTANVTMPLPARILRTAAGHHGVNVGVYATVLRGGEMRRGDAVMLG